MQWTIEDYLRRQNEVSQAKFGVGERTDSITKKIEHELSEVKADPYDLAEWIDIIILATDGYCRHGGSPDSFIRDLHAKLDIVAQRTYQRKDDDTFQHT